MQEVYPTAHPERPQWNALQARSPAENPILRPFWPRNRTWESSPSAQVCTFQPSFLTVRLTVGRDTMWQLEETVEQPLINAQQAHHAPTSSLPSPKFTRCILFRHLRQERRPTCKRRPRESYLNRMLGAIRPKADCDSVRNPGQGGGVAPRIAGTLWMCQPIAVCAVRIIGTRPTPRGAQHRPCTQAYSQRGNRSPSVVRTQAAASYLVTLSSQPADRTSLSER